MHPMRGEIMTEKKPNTTPEIGKNYDEKENISKT